MTVDQRPPGETRAAIGALVARAVEQCCARRTQCQYHQGYEDGLWAAVQRLPEVGP